MLMVLAENPSQRVYWPYTIMNGYNEISGSRAISPQIYSRIESLNMEYVRQNCTREKTQSYLCIWREVLAYRYGTRGSYLHLVIEIN